MYVTYSDLFQFCLVLIGFAGFFGIALGNSFLIQGVEDRDSWCLRMSGNAGNIG